MNYLAFQVKQVVTGSSSPSKHKQWILKIILIPDWFSSDAFAIILYLKCCGKHLFLLERVKEFKGHQYRCFGQNRLIFIYNW